MSFDQDSADQLVQQICAQLVRSQSLEGTDWESLAAIFEVDDESAGAFGYAFSKEDEWEAFVPDDETIELADELREVTAVPGTAKWLKTLIQITRSTGKIRIDFDYDGTRWQEDYEDPERFALSLRP